MGSDDGTGDMETQIVQTADLYVVLKNGGSLELALAMARVLAQGIELPKVGQDWERAAPEDATMKPAARA